MEGLGRVSGVTFVTPETHSTGRSVAPRPSGGWMVGVLVHVRRPAKAPVPVILLRLSPDCPHWLGTGGRIHAHAVRPVLRPNHHHTHGTGIGIVEVTTDRHGTSATRHDFPFDRNGTNRIAGRVDRRLCPGTRQCSAHRRSQPPAPSGAKCHESVLIGQVRLDGTPSRLTRNATAAGFPSVSLHALTPRITWSP